MVDPGLPALAYVPRTCAKCGGVSLRWTYTGLFLLESRFWMRWSRRWLTALVCDGCGFTELYAARDRTVLPPRL